MITAVTVWKDTVARIVRFVIIALPIHAAPMGDATAWPHRTSAPATRDTLVGTAKRDFFVSTTPARIRAFATRILLGTRAVVKVAMREKTAKHFYTATIILACLEVVWRIVIRSDACVKLAIQECVVTELCSVTITLARMAETARSPRTG